MDQDYSTSLDQLVTDAQRKPLVLFLGAGIYEGKMPLWGKLLEKLLVRALNKVPEYQGYPEEKQTEVIGTIQQKLTIYEQATLVKYLLDEQYRPILKDAIYGDINEAYPQDLTMERLASDFKLLHGIAKLCQCELVHAAVTYNYDDLLEKALGFHKRKAFNVYGYSHEGTYSENTIPVYHVHGFVKNENRIPSEDSLVVLSLDEYFHNIIQPYSWQTTSQLHFLHNNTCLYIGCSLSDINMQRLLSFAKSYVHNESIYVLSAYRSFECGREINDFLWESRSSVLQTMGVHQLISGYEFSTVAETVAKLAQRIEDLKKGNR